MFLNDSHLVIYTVKNKTFAYLLHQ